MFTDYNLINFIGTDNRYTGILLYSLLFLFFLSFRTYSKQKVSQIISFNLVIANLLAMFGILQLLFPEMLNVQHQALFDNKVYATFEIPNFFGQYLAIVITLGLFQKLQYAKLRKFIFLLPLIALLLTRSKVAILAAVLAIGIYLYQTSKLQIRNLLLLITPVFLISIYSGFFHIHRSIASRIEIWKSSIQILWDHPFGINFAGLENLFAGYIHKAHYFYEQNLSIIYDYSHNIVLDYFLIFGVFACFFLYPIYQTLIPKLRDNKAKVLLLFPILCIGFFSFFSITSLLLISLMLAIIFQSQDKEERQVGDLGAPTALVFALTLCCIFSLNLYGKLEYRNFQENQNLQHLITGMRYNPSNINLASDLLSFVGEKELDTLYQENLKVFGSKNLVLQRAYLKSKAKYGKDVEAEIQDLIQQNPNDFKNLLLLANYYYFKQEFSKAQEVFEEIGELMPAKSQDLMDSSSTYYNNFQKFQALKALQNK